MQNFIYAILVGINNYKKIRKLKGCISDIEKIENYLIQNLPSCKIEKLLDKKALKGSIVSAFTNLQLSVSVDDTVLFYFSGHGTQEEADEIWNETDGHLESIVCYDDHPDKLYEYLLSDKELRYLIFELSKTGCHIVTIFDCCHSADNTRNTPFIESSFHNEEVIERRYAYVFPKRRWEDFIFHADINQADIAGKDVNDFLPQGSHVQISACESDESAIEVNGEGVFTRTLLKTLKDTGGNLSYYALQNRIRQYLRFVYKQQPRIYTKGSSGEEAKRLLTTRFLVKQDIDEQRYIAEAVFNRGKDGC